MPTLLVRTLMAEIGDLAKAKGFTQSRVLHKVNAKGELVVALLIAPTTPGEWGPPTPTGPPREAKRVERR